MNRRNFLASALSIPLTGIAMKMNELNSLAGSFGNTGKMPVLFVGHGSPMNALEENGFTEGWRTIANSIPKPTAILAISAHWETRGTFVTAMEKPRTIHDFGGFPKELHAIEYPAPGDPELAKQAKEMIKKTETGLDDLWGLDHGTWSILRRMYPEADIPVVQLSLDYTRPASFHYKLGGELSKLREKGVLILGSGNIVHNLRMVAWNRLDEAGYGFDWALEADETIKKLVLSGDPKPLQNYSSLGRAVNLAIPTPEHFLPLLYILALREKDEPVSFFNSKAVAGSLTMTSLKITRA